MRKSIRFLVLSSRMFYGIPVFISFTPSERHSGLALHLHRGRVSDPAYSKVSMDWHRCLGYEYPSLCPEEDIPGLRESIVGFFVGQYFSVFGTISAETR